MKRLMLLLALALTGSALAEEKVYLCKFDENAPFGVTAWSQSDRVRKGIGKETRFLPYDAGNAAQLANDALVDRGSGGGGSTDPRETGFWQAYDSKGWSIYIESKEPLVEELVNLLVNPRSAGHNESYELFFAPGVKDVPYYQVYITPYQNRTTFYDWGSPHQNYRSLKEDVRVESLPLKDGVGTFVFIPWHVIYDKAPVDGGRWRFTLIRWMPFAKAGGVTWGGQVHETGRFGWVEFEKPSPEQRMAIQTRLETYARYKFEALADRLAEYWSDPHIGDPTFHTQVLAPTIERLKGGQGEQGAFKTMMEFDYQVDALRTQYLQAKRFSNQ